MDADALERAWDPAAPGAGALRATAVAQLYFRMTSHHPLTILVVDAMCLAFGADGVTVQSLVDYLGITEDRVRFGLDNIPSEMRCTAQQLASEGFLISHNGATDGDVGGTAEDAFVNGSSGRRGEKEEVRYFLNYKRLLPLVYAHVTRLLLATCVTEVPPCRYVSAIKDAQLKPYSRPAESTAHAFFSHAAATTQAGGATADTASPLSAGETTGQKPSGTSSPSDTAALPSISSTASYVVADGTGEHIEVSDGMKRKSAIRGVHCLGCSCYFAVEEFQETLSRCPRCGKDVLWLCLQSIQRQLQRRLSKQHTLVRLLPAVSQIWKRTVAIQQAVAATTVLNVAAPENPSSVPERQTNDQTMGFSSPSGEAVSVKTPVSTSLPPPPEQLLNCDLANDPFLFQQALAFHYLYTCRFASVNDAASVVDVQEILTEPEYKERLRGKASLADQFRSRHRHAASVRVRLLSQKDVDAARREESHQKLLKRAMLPPWLRHTTSLEALGGSHLYLNPRQATVAAQQRVDTVERAGNEQWEAEEVRTNAEAVKGHVDSGGAVWRMASTTSGVVASSESFTTVHKRTRSVANKTGDAKAELTRAAAFIVEQFYEDEYDAVALPLSRKRLRL